MFENFLRDRVVSGLQEAAKQFFQQLNVNKDDAANPDAPKPDAEEFAGYLSGVVHGISKAIQASNFQTVINAFAAAAATIDINTAREGLEEAIEDAKKAYALARKLIDAFAPKGLLADGSEAVPAEGEEKTETA